MQYSSYGNDWNWYSDDESTNGRKEFMANNDENTVVSHILSKPFNARYVRIVVNTFQGWPVFRFELYAPFDDAYTGGESLGIAGGEVPDSALRASSAHG